MALSAELLVTGGLARDVAEARAKLQHALDTVWQPNASARMVTALGGPAGSDRRTCASSGAGAGDRAGTVAHERRGSGSIAARSGLAVVALGGGRTRAADAIDYASVFDGARGDRAAGPASRSATCMPATQPPPRTRWTRSSAATCWAKPVMRRRPFISRSADRSPVRAQATASLHVTGVSRRSVGWPRRYLPAHNRGYDEMERNELIEAVKAARERAYAPYSRFKVGARAAGARRDDLSRLQRRERVLRTLQLCGTHGAVSAIAAGYRPGISRGSQSWATRSPTAPRAARAAR